MDETWMSYPDNPWDRIITGNTLWSLWQGGMHYGPHMKPCAPTADDFDMVISMAGRGMSGQRVMGSLMDNHHSFYISDAKLGPLEMSFVSEAKDLVAQGIVDDMKILVRCQMGLNRSGLVVALTLLDQGFTPAMALSLIRAKRSPDALSNPWFVEYIHSYAAHLGMPSQEEGTNDHTSAS